MEGFWELIEGRLSVRFGEGTIVAPSARDIWAAEFRGLCKIGLGLVSGRPSDQISDVEFSRIAAEPVCRVTGSALTGIHITLEVRADNSLIPVPQSLSGAWSDQVIQDGVWYPIDTSLLAAVAEHLKAANIAIDVEVGLGSLIRLQQLADLGIEIINEVQMDPVKAISAFKTESESVPELVGALYQYQADGVAFLRRIASEGLGCILGDEMGLGKTLQVIALFLCEKHLGRTCNLVIAPATLLENWRRELALFAPSLAVVVHAGSARFGSRDRLKPFDVVVTSYETAVRDEPLLASISWNILALDEAQNIKNPQAQRTHAVKTIGRRTSIAVTGTPVENRLTDLWSIADFALPNILGSESAFESKYENSPEDASRLAPVVAPILLRRRVTDVAKDLPKKIDIPQPIAMTRDMAATYEKIRRSIEVEYGNSASLVALTNLRMFCTHPRLIGEWEEAPLNHMPKYRRLIEILEEIFAKGEKALIFSTYQKMADLLVTDLGRTFPNCYFNFIDGRTATSARQPVVDEFSAYAGPGALMLNPKAAGVGLNITAANHVVHYNPEWNPAVEDQASARAYRRKQTRPVTVHHLFMSDSVEEIVIDRLNFKRQLAEGAVVGHTGDTTSRDLLRALSISPMPRREELE